MINAAYDNVTPLRPRLEVVERQVADLDDGYTRIANELLEAVMAADLTARQLKVALAVIRKTYGFGKKMDRITNTQIAQMTGIHHTHVCKAKNDMIAMHIVVSSGNQIGINKVISEWDLSISRSSETLAKSANESLAKAANGHKPSQLNTKETIQKKEINTPLPPSEVSERDDKKSSRSKPTPYEAVLQCYNELAEGKLPLAESLNAKRKRDIKRLLSELKEPTVEAASLYFEAFFSTARQFYFGDNDRGWRASFDYLLRSDTLMKTREGAL